MQMSDKKGDSTVSGVVLNHSDQTYEKIDQGLVGKGGDKLFDTNGVCKRKLPCFEHEGISDHPVKVKKSY
ncbi:MAG: hypothetical protein H6779_03290 [Candidatus Nomurabacteria bacterium]|nr:hypothetical protein [Candidatus Nomurabacteria bacterium]USN87414.1 MAG: hypothetical protein H6779_03290 [Candidatus Nomurabacteria bacterium]